MHFNVLQYFNNKGSTAYWNTAFTLQYTAFIKYCIYYWYAIIIAFIMKYFAVLHLLFCSTAFIIEIVQLFRSTAFIIEIMQYCIYYWNALLLLHLLKYCNYFAVLHLLLKYCNYYWIYYWNTAIIIGFIIEIATAIIIEILQLLLDLFFKYCNSAIIAFIIEIQHLLLICNHNNIIIALNLLLKYCN